jgi:hypothetical protein
MVQLAAALGDVATLGDPVEAVDGEDPVGADDVWVGCDEVPWVGCDECPPQAAADRARDTKNTESTLWFRIACTPSVGARDGASLLDAASPEGNVTNCPFVRLLQVGSAASGSHCCHPPIPASS